MRFLCIVALSVVAWSADALYDPAREYVESAAVAARYPDPAIDIDTPGLAPDHDDFASHDELIAFVDRLSRRSRDLRVRTIGRSQERRAIPLLVFARPAAAAGPELQKNGKPTVLIIGLQHGNEPAGGEAALAFAAELATDAGSQRLERVNVLIVPRANPDGAHHFVRGLANGADLNRDHLLQATPEGRALGRVFTDYQPDVVLDCHEFGVKTRWVEKFAGLQRHDALIQYATVSNVPHVLTDASESIFREPLLRALSTAGLSHSWYYTSSYDPNDRVVSMGGVLPDTGRNIAGLRNAVSFLIETRGVGIGRAHFKRRVHTHLIAMRSFVDSASANADAVLTLTRAARIAVAKTAGKGDLVVLGAATRTRHTIELIDPDSGVDKPVDVEWRDALAIDVRQKRARPWAYVLPASETIAAKRLARLGATVLQLRQGGTIAVERYRITRADEAKKDDVRRNDDDAPASVVRIETVTEPAEIIANAGDFYVPLDQPLANLIAAALEPETQSSYAANRMLSLPQARSGETAYLPLYRVPIAVEVATVAIDSD